MPQRGIFVQQSLDHLVTLFNSFWQFHNPRLGIDTLFQQKLCLSFRLRRRAIVGSFVG